MTRRLFMDPSAYEVEGRLPVLLTHREWCRHLQGRGQLDPKHKRCLYSFVCVASSFVSTGQSWRYKRNA
jgi:hypothetical protein